MVRSSSALTIRLIEAGVDDILGSDLFVDPELVGDRVEGETELEVGFEHTALHIVDCHGMNVVLVCVEAVRKAAVSGRAADRLLVIRSYGLIVEVDRTFGSCMRTAEVKYQLAVNKYPQIVVTGESEFLICAVSVDTVVCSVSVQSEGNRKLHTEAEVFCKYAFVSIIKREKAPCIISCTA